MGNSFFAKIVPSCRKFTNLVSRVCIFGLALTYLSFSQERPNILMLLADDLGYSDLSVYGSQNISTPNLDQMAQDGMRFTDFYSPAPNCSPARTGFMTGRIPSRVGMYSYVPPNGPLFLPQQEITIASVLKYAGYQTAHVGKWHLNYDLTDQNLPQASDHGFEYSLGTENNASPNHLNPNNFHLNGIAVGTIQGYSCQIVADTTLAWIARRDTTKPFFVASWFHEPHSPIASPPELVARHGNASRANYYANIENLDSAVGRILDGLDIMGLRNNTLVIFSSDNGSVSNESNQPLRGVKSNTWDGGMREPGIFRWPGKIKAGAVNNTPAGLIDLFPTFAALAATQLPPDRPLDGVDIFPLLQEGVIQRTTPLFWFFYRVSPAAALRVGDYTIVGFLESGLPSSHSLSSAQMTWLKNANLVQFELYNIKDDIGESNDLSATEPVIFDSLRQQLIALHSEILTQGPNWFQGTDPVWSGNNAPNLPLAGCLDPQDANYNQNANISDVTQCTTPIQKKSLSGTKNLRVHYSNNNLSVTLSPLLNKITRLIIYNILGEAVVELLPSSPNIYTGRVPPRLSGLHVLKVISMDVITSTKLIL